MADDTDDDDAVPSPGSQLREPDGKGMDTTDWPESENIDDRRELGDSDPSKGKIFRRAHNTGVAYGLPASRDSGNGTPRYAEGGEVEASSSTGAESAVPGQDPDAEQAEGGDAQGDDDSGPVAEAKGVLNYGRAKHGLMQGGGQPSPGDDTAWGLVQGYRKKYDAYRAFAAAALQKGDLASAAKAATQAYPNVLDGTRIQFAPGPNGITATVSGAGGQGQALNLSPQQFNQWLTGQQGQYDNVMERGGAQLLQQLAGGPGGQSPPQVSQQPQQVAEEATNYAEGGSVEGEDEHEDAGLPEQNGPMPSERPNPDEQGAEPGGLPEQANPEQQGPLGRSGALPHQLAKRFMAYLMASDAAPPQVAQRYEELVDPQQQMDEGQRKLLAVQAAKQDSSGTGSMGMGSGMGTGGGDPNSPVPGPDRSAQRLTGSLQRPQGQQTPGALPPTEEGEMRPYASPKLAASQPGKYRSVPQGYQSPEPEKPAEESQIEKRSHQMFPYMSQEHDRINWVQQSESAMAKATATERAAEIRGVHGEAMSTTKAEGNVAAKTVEAQGRVDVADKRLQGYKYGADQRLKGVDMKTGREMNVAIQKMLSNAQSANDRTIGGILQKKLANVPLGTPLSPQDEQMLKNLAARTAKPEDMAQPQAPAGQQQAPAQQQAPQQQRQFTPPKGQGWQYSPTLKQFRDRAGNMYDANGQPIQQ